MLHFCPGAVLPKNGKTWTVIRRFKLQRGSYPQATVPYMMSQGADTDGAMRYVLGILGGDDNCLQQRLDPVLYAEMQNANQSCTANWLVVIDSSKQAQCENLAESVREAVFRAHVDGLEAARAAKNVVEAPGCETVAESAVCQSIDDAEVTMKAAESVETATRTKADAIASFGKCIAGFVCIVFDTKRATKVFCFGEASKEVARKLVPRGHQLKSCPLTGFDKAYAYVDNVMLLQRTRMQTQKRSRKLPLEPTSTDAGNAQKRQCVEAFLAMRKSDSA